MTELRAKVVEDRIERTIEIEVIDGPVIDVSASWHRKVRRIQVDLLTIRTLNGQTIWLAASGGMRRVDGTTSELQRGDITWHPHAKPGGLDLAPVWAQQIWREAPAGLTTWRFKIGEE